MPPAPFTLRTIRFCAGSSPGRPATEVHPGHVTVLVGPNNVGKSLSLNEMDQWAAGGQQPPRAWDGGQVIESIAAHWPADEPELRAALAPREIAPPPHENTVVIAAMQLAMGPGGVAGGSGEVGVTVANHSGAPWDEFLRSAAMPHMRVRLGGRERFELAQPRQVTALDRPPSNHLMALWRDAHAYERVAAMVVEGIGKHFIVNAADLPTLSVGLAPSAPPAGWQDSVAPPVVAYMRTAKPLLEHSDGIQNYVGLVAALHSLPQPVLLVDEPEAHLHPSLSRILGGQLTQVAKQREGNLIVATHSAEFLLGCVTQSADTTIVRLDYEDDVASARVLPAAAVASLTRDPLLRSASALDALFVRACVVCEGDSDRVIYEEINRRLMESASRDGLADAIFLNAQNWQTIPSVAGPLRQLGIPAAMVVDLDTLTRGDGWAGILAAVGMDATARGRLTQERNACGQLIEAAGRMGGKESAPWRAKQEGLAALEAGPRAQVERLIDKLAALGVFVVPVGEVERWLPGLGVGNNKQTFVVDMLRRLGVPGSSSYVPAAAGDVWDFVRRIASWTGDAQRLGMPD